MGAHKECSEMEDRCMIKLYDTGAYLVNGTELVEDSGDAKLILRNKRNLKPGRSSEKYHCLSYSEGS